MPVFVLLRSKYAVKRTNQLNFVLLTVTFIQIAKVEDSNLQCHPTIVKSVFYG